MPPPCDVPQSVEITTTAVASDSTSAAATRRVAAAQAHLIGGSRAA